VSALPAYSGELVQLPVRGQQTQAIFIERPPAAPPWVVVLFAGDNGAVALDDTGPTTMRANFLLRTAEYWTSAGDTFAIVDAPSDRSSGMNGQPGLSGVRWDVNATQVLVVSNENDGPGFTI